MVLLENKCNHGLARKQVQPWFSSNKCNHGFALVGEKPWLHLLEKTHDCSKTSAISYQKSTTDKIAYKHPAIFPEKLAHDHIVSWSNENDKILDPFMGSGTTGKVCRMLNRKFIGIEKDKDYFDIARTRINEQAKPNSQRLTDIQI